jgi:NADH-quinone oxidoreductase subunit N
MIDLTPLFPELTLGLLAAGLLVLDLVAAPDEKRVVGWAAILGLVVALFPAVLEVGGGRALAVYQTYAVDPFAGFIKIIAIIAGILVIGSALDFFRDHPTSHEGDIYVLMVFMVLGLAVMAAAADLIVLFLAIEWVSLISYVLAGSLKSDRKSSEAGIKYFFYGATASAVMLFGFSYLYGAAGTTNLYALPARLATAPPGFLVVAAVLIFAGLGFKISAVPFHQWTPDVYEGAPTPIVAFLSVASKAAGFAALLRVLYVALPPGSWVAIIAAVAAASMILGNLLALSQPNIKRMLAYSSIAHAGYMMIGVVAFSAAPGVLGSGISALLFYLLAYVFTNVGAFAVAIAVARAAGSDAIAGFAGLGQRAPFAASAMGVFMLALTGIPPTGLFWGKVFLFGAAIQNGFLWLAVVGIANSVVSLYYYVGVIRAMWQMPPPGDLRPAPVAGGSAALPPVGDVAGEPPLGDLRPAAAPLETPLLRAVLVITTAGTVVPGFFPDAFVRLAQAASLLLKI